MKTQRKSPRDGLTLLELIVVLVILLALSTLLVPALSWVGQRSQAVATRDNLVRLREILINKYVVDMGDLPRPRTELTTGGSPTRLNHPQLVYLFVNPRTHENSSVVYDDLLADSNALGAQRWQGPYITHSGSEYFVTDTDSSLATGSNYTSRYGVGDYNTDPNLRNGDPTVIDAWGQPIVIQQPEVDVPNNITYQIARQHARLVSPGPNGRIDTPPDVLMPTLAERNDDLVLFLFRHDEHADAHLNLENPN